MLEKWNEERDYGLKLAPLRAKIIVKNQTQGFFYNPPLYNWNNQLATIQPFSEHGGKGVPSHREIFSKSF